MEINIENEYIEKVKNRLDKNMLTVDEEWKTKLNLITKATQEEKGKAT